MTKCSCKKIYFFICLAAVVFLSSIRSYPVYGKLDFLLLDGRPWWPSWRPMIEQVLQEGTQPVFSDSTTSTVLRAVFAQQAVTFRLDPRFFRLNVEKLMALNKEKMDVLPVGAVYLLLHGDKSCSAGQKTILDILQNGLLLAEEGGHAKAKYPYRCLINLRGFTPSWVPDETHHWSSKFADTSFWYEFNGMRGKDMIQLLHESPPENCSVYF